MERFPQIAVADFREWVQSLQGLTAYMVDHMSSPRTLTPMFHAASPPHDDHDFADGTVADVWGAPLDRLWFDSNEGRIRLVDEFVVPFIREHEPRMVGWTFTGMASIPDVEPDSKRDVAVVVAIDREVHEVWEAELTLNADRYEIGEWTAWTPNETEGRLVQPVQEALR